MTVKEIGYSVIWLTKYTQRGTIRHRCQSAKYISVSSKKDDCWHLHYNACIYNVFGGEQL